MPSFSIRNFGCRVNQAETFGWAETLRESGLRLEDDPDRSDVVLVNTCTLTERADRDVRRFIRRTTRANPGAKLVVTGCYAERAAAEIASVPGVALVVPNQDKASLPGLILKFASPVEASDGGGQRRSETGRHNPPEPDEGCSGESLTGTASTPEIPGWQSAAEEYGDGDAEDSFRARAFFKVQDGCDDRCTFCVIPGVRGSSVSVAAGDAAAAVRGFFERGFHEVVLAGIHLSSYGDDLTPPGSLLGLLKEIVCIPGPGRLRLSSLDPRRTDDGLLEHIAGAPKICRHFHLSLQHASERILRKMGRATGPGGGSAARSSSILAELRRRSPEAALGADVIVGFPGETDEDFATLRGFLEQSPLTYFHVFSYSQRQGTPAAGLPQVPQKVRSERARALRRLSTEKNLAFRRCLAGREFEAVVIRASGEPPAGDRGEVLTDNGIRVFVPAGRFARRDLVRVRVTRVSLRETEGVVLG